MHRIKAAYTLVLGRNHVLMYALRKKSVMNTLMKKISFSLVLSASAVAAFANPGQPRSEREAVRDVRQHQDAGERGGAQTARNGQPSQQDRSSEESQKKHNKLSPEERRELRRQINEAGQDLYTRKP